VIPASARRVGIMAMALATGLLLASCGRDTGRNVPGPEISFAILSAETQGTAEPLWRPFLDDLSKAVGAPVQARFGASYGELVSAMKDGDVQAGWFSASPAVEAVDTANAEVLARTVDLSGEDSYRAILIVRKGQGMTLDRALTCNRTLRLALGDADSTSGMLAPMTFLFHPRGVDPLRCYLSVRTSTHQANAFAVAAGTVDVATSNTATLAAIRDRSPQIFEQIEEIWRSPPLPEGAILARTDMDPATKEKLRSFLLTYGQGEGVQAERQRRVLTALHYSRFRAADATYLNPIREMLANQRLAEARAQGDTAAYAVAQTELQKLRLQREVQP
jgi:phosphate/phosphite/phosphonate ABC transporters, periplasmic binding protein